MGSVAIFCAYDVNHVFAPCQAYFDYSSAKLDADTISSAYYFQESLAVAC